MLRPVGSSLRTSSLSVVSCTTLRMSTSGACPVTVTVSSTAPTCICAFTVTSTAPLSSMPSRTTVENPGSVNVTE